MPEQNKQLVCRFAQAFEAGDAAAMRDIVAADVVDHNAPPGQPGGIEGLLGAVAMFKQGLPDMKIDVVREVAEGDIVVQYGTVSGTNRGPMMGAPATNKRASFAYMDMHRIAGGRIAETWHVEDIAGMLQQLGLAG